MNRVCLTKDGKLIEMQGGGDDRPDLMGMRLDTLKQNALNAGYKEAEIEVKWVTDAEWEHIQVEINKPTTEQLVKIEKENLIQAKIREQAIEALKKEGKLTADEKLTSKTIGKEAL